MVNILASLESSATSPCFWPSYIGNIPGRQEDLQVLLTGAGVTSFGQWLVQGKFFSASRMFKKNVGSNLSPSNERNLNGQKKTFCWRKIRHHHPWLLSTLDIKLLTNTLHQTPGLLLVVDHWTRSFDCIPKKCMFLLLLECHPPNEHVPRPPVPPSPAPGSNARKGIQSRRISTSTTSIQGEQGWEGSHVQQPNEETRRRSIVTSRTQGRGKNTEVATRNKSIYIYSDYLKLSVYNSNMYDVSMFCVYCHFHWAR